MWVNIEGLHENALLRLMQRHGEKTAVAMTRILIREAANQTGDWLTEEQVEQEATEAVTEE